MITESGARCCPKCQGIEFNREVSCASGRLMQKGATYQCLNDVCGWTGFGLQLIAKSDARDGLLNGHPALDLASGETE